MEKNKKILIIFSVVMFVLFGCDTKNSSVANKEVLTDDVQNCQGNECNKAKNAISETITSQEFKQKIDSGEYIVIDIRTSQEHQEERIDVEQLNIDIYADDFDEKMKNLDFNKKYLIYCRSGSRSKRGLLRMRAIGFEEVYDLGGGIIEWKKNGFAVKTTS